MVGVNARFAVVTEIKMFQLPTFSECTVLLQKFVYANTVYSFNLRE